MSLLAAPGGFENETSLASSHTTGKSENDSIKRRSVVLKRKRRRAKA